MVELTGLRGRDQGLDDVGVGVELRDGSGLVQRELVPLGGGLRELGAGDRESLVDLGSLHLGALGDLRSRHL